MRPMDSEDYRRDARKKLRRGKKLLADAEQNSVYLASALVGIHGAMEDHVRALLASNQDLPEDRRHAVLDRGATRWRDLIDLLRECRVLTEDQLRLVREANKARIDAAHGNSYSGTRESLEEYAALVDEVIQSDSPSSETESTGRARTREHARESQSFSTVRYETLFEFATTSYNGLGLEGREAAKWADRWIDRLGDDFPQTFTSRFLVLFEFATTSYNGLGLEGHEAVKWADRWIDRLGDDFPQTFTSRFLVLFEFATTSYNGLGLEGHEAVKWADRWIDRLGDDFPQTFTSRFLVLFEFATTSYNGLGLEGHEAVKWADRWIDRLGDDFPQTFTSRFLVLFEFATTSYNGPSLEGHEAVKWAEERIRTERGIRPKGRGRRPDR